MQMAPSTIIGTCKWLVAPEMHGTPKSYCTHTHIHTHTHTKTHRHPSYLYIHVYAHTHTYTYTQAQGTQIMIRIFGQIHALRRYIQILTNTFSGGRCAVGSRAAAAAAAAAAAYTVRRARRNHTVMLMHGCNAWL